MFLSFDNWHCILMVTIDVLFTFFHKSVIWVNPVGMFVFIHLNELTFIGLKVFHYLTFINFLTNQFYLLTVGNSSRLFLKLMCYAFSLLKKLTPYRGTKTFSRNISVDFPQKYNRNTLKKDKTHWQDIWGSSFDIGCRALQKLLHRTAKVRSSRDVWDRSELVPRLRFELPFWGERWPWLVRELDAEKPLWFLWPKMIYSFP